MIYMKWILLPSLILIILSPLLFAFYDNRMFLLQKKVKIKCNKSSLYLSTYVYTSDWKWKINYFLRELIACYLLFLGCDENQKEKVKKAKKSVVINDCKLEKYNYKENWMEDDGDGEKID